MDLSTLVPLPVRISFEFCSLKSEGGVGVAVCQDVLVISCCDKLQVFALPDDIARGGVRGSPSDLVHVRTLGGAAPMEFQFADSCRPFISGFMAFTDDRLLLVTDAGHDAVHVIDVVRGTHEGYVAAPGTIAGPRGVAAYKSMAAVSAWKFVCRGDHVVHVFHGDGESKWTAVRVIDHGRDTRLWAPYGLRFTADGLKVAVTNCHNSGLSVFSTEDGSLHRHMAIGVAFWVSMDCENWEDGWIVCDDRSGDLVVVADKDTGASVVTRGGSGDTAYALAVVPGVGVVVRHCSGLQFLATPDAVAMASMSYCKVAWMTAVGRLSRND